MTYPKNDNDFVEGVVTFVVDEGRMLKVGHKVNWLHGPYEGNSLQPKPDFEIKPGMRYRAYAFMSISRGVYIGGRVVRPYITKEQALENAKKDVKDYFRHTRGRKPKF